MKIYIKSASALRRYVRAYWDWEDGDILDDFVDESSDDPYDDDAGYSDFDEYELYDYSEYEDFYRYILRRKIYVSEKVAKDIPDYNAYRKALFNTLFLSMKSGESIETLYNELSIYFPGIVKGGFLSESDMLVEIVDAALYAQSLLKPH